MKRWLIPAFLLLLCAVFLTAAGASGQNRPVLVAVQCRLPRVSVVEENGQLVQTLEFDRFGQAAAGPLSPGRYCIRSAWGETAFTLRSNGALCQVEGEGWSDGEILHISRQTSGSLTVLYDGDWNWSLEGERAGEAIPTLKDGSCRFSHLPLGWYVLTGADGEIPILLTEDDSDQTLDLRE